MPELRARISEYLKARCSVEYAPQNIVVTVGASEAIDLSLRAICNPGDEILVPDPCYVSYAPCVELCGGVPVSVKCSAENEFKLTPEMLEAVITPKTKALIFPYPTNPTGGIMEREYLEAIVPVIEKHDLLVISDEIYAELTYGGQHVSIASLPGMQERTVLINGFSKAFAMTGWRIGYVAGPTDVLNAILKIHQYCIMCANTASQHAALYALEEGFQDGFQSVNEMREEYDKRRRFMVKSLNDLGLTCFEPKGAFYVFPSVASTGMSGEEFAEKLLLTERVAVVPGSAFGESAKDHVRCSYASSMKNLTEAIERIARFLKTL